MTVRYPTYRQSGLQWPLEVPNGWGVVSTKRRFVIVNGSTPSSNVEAYWDGSITWVTPEDLARLTDGAILTSRRSLTRQGLANCGASMVPAGSLIISTRAPIGLVALASVPLATNQGCKALVGGPEINRRFAYYYYLASRPLLEAFGRGSTFTELSSGQLGSFPLLLPPLEEQATIAGYLDRETARIDALIAKQERLIELLWEKRDSLVSRCVTRGLDGAAPMKDSAVPWFGEVPAHWTVAGFRHYLSSEVDYRGRTPTKVPDGVLLLTARNIRNGRVDYAASQEFIDPAEYEQVMSRGVPEVGDVLLTTEAPLGQVANVDRTDIALAQRIIKFRGKRGVLNNEYLKYLMMSRPFQDSLMRFATGSTALGIKAERLSYLRLLLPPIGEQRAIVDHINAVIPKIDALVEKSKVMIAVLRERRAALISEAVTGQIDVRGWELDATAEQAAVLGG